MTDKIIIDGVDVAGCQHLKNDGIKKPICISGGCRGVYKSCLCSGNIDCDYKQLKRLEADYETLKTAKDFASINLINYIADNEELKAENARLKEENSGLKEFNVDLTKRETEVILRNSMGW